MKGLITFLGYFFFISLTSSFSQSVKTIEGTILDSTRGEQLSFATVYNLSTNKATITNSEGYFELELSSWQDTVTVSYVGYKSDTLRLLSSLNRYLIKLKPSSVKLEMITVIPKEYRFIHQLLESCKEKRSKNKKTIKAYYQLKSYIENNQIELVEAFYNADIYGYDLLDLKLKSGRVGLRHYESSFFGSLETSKPLYKHKLFFSSSNFPTSPLELSAKKMQKRYYLELEKAYVDNNLDSVYVAFLYPKKKKGNYFSSRVWINASDTSLIKVELQGNSLDLFPLSPIYPDDYLSDKSLKMTKTFKKVNGETYFQHIDFQYKFNYHKEGKGSFPVETKAVLFTYEEKTPFFIPFYGIDIAGLTDYQKMAAIPYNEFFWKYNDELKMNEERDHNQAFMNDDNTVKSYNYLKKQSSLKRLFDNPVRNWSTQRLAFRELPKQIEYEPNQAPYQLSGGVFLDYNQYKDSTHILSSSLFDTFKSYYLFHLDYQSNCYINLYFDLIEMKRRAFFENSPPLQTDEDVRGQYREMLVQMKKTQLRFDREVERGRNPEEIRKWNTIIKSALKIDNLSIFGLEETEK
ncbi:MAG: carboxypeptidase-like regulatory domain-containing protein [Vicingaceae bacterium]